MAQLAVGVGGAVLGGVAGFFIGGPAGVLAGAGLGFSLGGLVGAELFPVKGPTVYGSRLGDLTVTASTYGIVRPIVYGNVQVAGNLIWGTPIKEVATSTHVGGGAGKGAGSKGGGTQVEYTYTATFAVGLCQGEIQQIVRIWMNGAIVYDISAGTSQAVGTSLTDPLANAVANANDAVNASNNPNSPVNFRFYPGSTTQMPDSLIEADKGVGNVPAYRGLCYLVFDQLLLTNFGDRIPNIQVEVTTSAVESNNFQELERGEFTPTYQIVQDSSIGGGAFREGQAGYFGFIPGPGHPTEENVLETNISTLGGANLNITYTNDTVPDLFSAYSPHAVAVNPLTLEGFVWGVSPTGIVSFDLQTMEVISEVTLDYVMGTFDTWNSTSITGSNPLWVGFDQNLYGLLESDVLKVNPATMTDGVMMFLGTDDNIGSPFASNSATLGGPLGLVGPGGVENYTVVCGGNLSHVHVVELSTKLTATGNSFISVTPGAVGALKGASYILGLTGTFLGAGGGADIFIDQVSVNVSVGVGITGVNYTRTATIENVLLLDPSTFDAAATGWSNVFGACFDPTDGTLVFSGLVTTSGGTGNSYFMKWAPGGGLVYATQYPAGTTAAGSGSNSDLREGSFAVFTGTHAVQFDLATGDVLGVFPWVLTNTDGTQLYTGAFNAILMASSGPFVWDKIVVGLLSNVPPSLATFAGGICKLSGMDDSKFDVTQLATIPMDGYALAQRTTGKAILTPVLQLHQIDVVETDYKLVFQPRGGAPVATITQDLMIRPDASGANNAQSEPYAENRVQEIDMPMRYTVSYIDETVQYQANTQMAKRTVFPNRSMYSDQQIDLQVGLVMTPDAAAQKAEMLLYSLWLARHSFKCTLPPDFMFLNSADPVTLTLDSGFTMRGRIGSFDTGMNNASECTIFGETDGQYVSTTTGQAGDIPPNLVPVFVQTNFFLLDVPLLRDPDDTAGTAIRAYWAAAPYAAGTWPASQLQGSADNDVWNPLDVEVNEAVYGTIEGALPDAIGCFHIRESEFINVRVQQGGTGLASCTYTQLANGLNNAAVFKSNGDIEIIGYLTVTVLANNRYQLSGLARGRRGTDTMAGGHGIGETILFLNSATIDPITLPLTARGARGFYRAVTAGTVANAAPIKTQTFNARDQMPYAPVQVVATLSGSDIVLTWNRRARVNGGLIEGTGNVPLGESSESYSFDIYDAMAANVIRTLASTSPTVTYTAAQITADFGGPITSINLSVYQISATVGRGFARLDQLEVI